MNEDDKLRLQRNHQLIVDNVRLCDVVDKLLSDIVLDYDLLEQIESKTTSRERIQLLLTILPTRGPNAYKSFRAALFCKECHRHIVTALDGTDLVEARRLLHEAVSKSLGPSTSGADVTNMAAIRGPSTSGADVINMAAIRGPSTCKVDSYETLDSGMVSSSQTTRKTRKTKGAAIPARPIKKTTTRDVIIPASGATHDCQTDDSCFVVGVTTITRIKYADKGRSTTVIPASGATGDCCLGYPTGVAYSFHTNTILVADWYYGCIMRFDMDGSNGRHFVKPGDTSCGQYMPWDVATSRVSGRVFVTDRENQRLLVFTHNGDYVTSIPPRGTGDGQFGDVCGLTCHQGTILVSDQGNRRVAIVTEDGVHIRHIETGLSRPRYVAVGPGDTIYVTNYDVIDGRDCGNVRVYRWDGTPVRQFGDREGRGSYPNGVTVDRQGYVCVAWSHHHRVDVYNSQRTHTFGRDGEGPGELLWPHGLELLPDGRILVCDSANHRLQIF